MRYFLFIVLFFFPAIAYAAEFRFERQVLPVQVGDTFIVQVVLQSVSDAVNALEGSVRFPSSVALVDVRLRDSLVPLWLSAPAVQEEGRVHFAGVLPGGFTGDGNMFTLVFKAVRAGNAQLSFGNDSVAYRNDGLGTPTALSLHTDAVRIYDASGALRSADIAPDITAPDPFTPEVVSGTLFGFKGRTLVFTAQDGDSGIAGYEIARSYLGGAREDTLSWSPTNSPYSFAQGDSIRHLYVRAIDRAGNTRIAEVPPQDFSIIALLLAWRYVFLAIGFAALYLLVVQFRRR